MKSNETFVSTASSIVGLELSHAWRGYSTAIFLEFGELQESKREDGTLGNAKGDITIGFESDWRMESETAIICGSMSEEKFWEAELAKAIGQKLKCVSIVSRLPEISVQMTGNVWFTSFSSDEGQPDWMLIDRRHSPHRSFGIWDGKIMVEQTI